MASTSSRLPADNKKGVLKSKIPLVVFQGNAPNATLNFLCHNGDVTKPKYDHLLATERSGRAEDGNYYNMTASPEKLHNWSANLPSVDKEESILATLVRFGIHLAMEVDGLTFHPTHSAIITRLLEVTKRDAYA